MPPISISCPETPWKKSTNEVKRKGFSEEHNLGSSNILVANLVVELFPASKFVTLSLWVFSPTSNSNAKKNDYESQKGVLRLCTMLPPSRLGSSWIGISYTPKNQHDIGKSPFSIGKYIFKWWVFYCHVSFRWGHSVCPKSSPRKAGLGRSSHLQIFSFGSLKRYLRCQKWCCQTRILM